MLLRGNIALQKTNLHLDQKIFWSSRARFQGLANIPHYIILNNAILKSNSSIFPQSEGYIKQYTPLGVYGLIVNEKNEENICLMIVKMI